MKQDISNYSHTTFQNNRWHTISI